MIYLMYKSAKFGLVLTVTYLQIYIYIYIYIYMSFQLVFSQKFVYSVVILLFWWRINTKLTYDLISGFKSTWQK